MLEKNIYFSSLDFKSDLLKALKLPNEYLSDKSAYNILMKLNYKYKKYNSKTNQ